MAMTMTKITATHSIIITNIIAAIIFIIVVAMVDSMAMINLVPKCSTRARPITTSTFHDYDHHYRLDHDSHCYATTTDAMATLPLAYWAPLSSALGEANPQCVKTSRLDNWARCRSGHHCCRYDCCIAYYYCH